VTGIPTSDLWILIAHGEGAASRVVSDLRTGLHDLMCCCGLTPNQCRDEWQADILTRMEDEDNWALDEDGQPFSFYERHECGSIEITRLALDDAEVAR
jgi:hypothetical protein